MGKKTPLFSVIENLESRVMMSASQSAVDSALVDDLLNGAVSQATSEIHMSLTTEQQTYGSAGIGTAVTASGTTTILVSDYDQGGEGVGYHDNDASNNGGVYRTSEGVDLERTTEGGYNVGWINAGEWQAYTINVEKAGTYDVTLRYASTSEAKLHLEIYQDGKWTVLSSVATGNTGAYQTWADMKISGVSLASGSAVLRVVADTPGFNYSKVSLTNTGSTQTTDSTTTTTPETTPTSTPTASGTTVTASGTTTILVSDYDQGGEGVGYHDNDASNNGGVYRTSEGVDLERTTEGGYNVGWINAGEWQAYTINVEKAGTYDVTLRYASTSEAKLHLEIYQDGKWTVLSSVATGNTGAYQAWADMKISGVSLASGSAVLRVVADTPGFNYSKVSLTNTGSTQTTDSTTTTTPETTPTSTPTASGTTVTASGTTTILVSDYDQGGEGVGYHDNDASNNGGVYRTSEGVDLERTTEGGYNVGWINAGEWQAYTINVEKAGTYDVTLRYASTSEAKLHLEIYQDGKWTVLSSVATGNTGAYQAWADMKISGVSLASGSAVLRVVADTPGFNYSKVSLTKQADVVNTAPVIVPTFTSAVVSMTTYQRLIINGSSANDNITVSSANGILTVTNGAYSQQYTGVYGDIVIHGGDGNDVITVQGSVNIATLLYGDAGNDTILASGSGYNIIVTIGGGNDTVTGNGINTSFWVDQAGTDVVNASATEIAAGHVHQVASFYQPYTTDVTSSQYVSKELLGQNLTDPAGNGTVTYTNRSLWGNGPSQSDIYQGGIADCYLLADLQSAAQESPAKLMESVVDLGDGTYAVQFKRNGVSTYVRVDGDFGGGSGIGSESGVWSLVIEKAYAFFRNGGNSYSSLNYGDPASTARDLGYSLSYMAVSSGSAAALSASVQSALSSGIGLVVATSGSIKSGAPLIGSHAYSIVGTTTSSSGEILFMLRNPWGFDGAGSDGNASDGIVLLTYAQMTANFNAIMKMA